MYLIRCPIEEILVPVYFKYTGIITLGESILRNKLQKMRFNYKINIVYLLSVTHFC